LDIFTVFIITAEDSQTYSYTNSNIHSYTEIKTNKRITTIIWHRSQVHRHGKWVPNYFSDWVVWQFRCFFVKWVIST